jgi:hypothetical protein
LYSQFAVKRIGGTQKNSNGPQCGLQTACFNGLQECLEVLIYVVVNQALFQISSFSEYRSTDHQILISNRYIFSVFERMLLLHIKRTLLQTGSATCLAAYSMATAGSFPGSKVVAP